MKTKNVYLKKWRLTKYDWRNEDKTNTHNNVWDQHQQIYTSGSDRHHQFRPQPLLSSMQMRHYFPAPPGRGGKLGEAPVPRLAPPPHDGLLPPAPRCPWPLGALPQGFLVNCRFWYYILPKWHNKWTTAVNETTFKDKTTISTYYFRKKRTYSFVQRISFCSTFPPVHRHD